MMDFESILMCLLHAYTNILRASSIPEQQCTAFILQKQGPPPMDRGRMARGVWRILERGSISRDPSCSVPSEHGEESVSYYKKFS